MSEAYWDGTSIENCSVTAGLAHSAASDVFSLAMSGRTSRAEHERGNGVQKASDLGHLTVYTRDTRFLTSI